MINWLLGLDAVEMLFFNNVNLNKNLIVTTSEVSLPDEVRSYTRRIGGEIEIRPDELREVRASGGVLVASYEDIDLNKFSESEVERPIIGEFGCPNERTNILILRNPLNMIPSTHRMLERRTRKQLKVPYNLLKSLKNPKALKSYLSNKFKSKKDINQELTDRLCLWRNYALLAMRKHSPSRGSFLPIVFDNWVSDQSYRDSIACELGYTNRDRFRDFVSDAGGGSSYEGVNFRPTGNDVVTRWNRIHDKSSFTRLFRDEKETVDLMIDLLGAAAVPSELLEQTSSRPDLMKR